MSDWVTISAVSGMGGVGKTELALQYALDNDSAYPAGRVWFQARSGDLGSQILLFGEKQLGLTPPDTIQGLKDKVEWLWARWRPPEGAVLLVLDDVSDYQEIREFLPQDVRFKVICTTRLQTLDLGFEPLPLAVLDLEDALDLLRSLAGEKRVNDEPEAATAICEWLGYLPLGLELVGQYLHQRSGLSLAKMRLRLKKKRLEQQALRGATYPTTAEKGVRDAFELTWQDMTPEAQTVACVLSIFALAPIPWQLVEMSLPDWDEEELEDVRDGVLVQQSLLEDSGNGFYELHQLVREFLREKLAMHPEQDSLKQCVGNVMVLTASQMPQTPSLEHIVQSTPLLPHWKEVTKNLLACIEGSNTLIWPFIALGRFYEGQGLYAVAEYWLEGCLNATRQRYGEEHLDVATALDNLAGLYEVRGKYEQSESLFLQALKILRRVLGAEHLDTATTLNNLALTYQSQGKYDQAESYFLRVLEIKTKELGENHPVVAIILNNLAELYRVQGEYEQAEALCLQALEIRIRELREEHPDVSQSLNNLALISYEQGKYEQAKSLFLKTLDIKRRVLVEDHPSIASVLSGLAILYRLKMEYNQAELYFLQSLKIEKKAFGEDHPNVAATLNNLAGVYKEQRKYDQAEFHYLQAQSIWIQALGEDHPSVGQSLNNLAELYRVQEKYGQAEPLFLQSLAIRKKTLGEDNPKVATTLGNLATLYAAQGNYEQAEIRFFQTLEIMSKSLGGDHPKVAVTLNNLAGLYKEQGKYEQAETQYLEALSILGQDHPYSQGVCNNFFGCLVAAHQAGLAHTLSDHPLTQSLLQQIRDNEP